LAWPPPPTKQTVITLSTPSCPRWQHTRLDANQFLGEGRQTLRDTCALQPPPTTTASQRAPPSSVFRCGLCGASLSWRIHSKEQQRAARSRNPLLQYTPVRKDWNARSRYSAERVLISEDANTTVPTRNNTQPEAHASTKTSRPGRVGFA
ncbi:unnamed protein product, partial [Ectocarpus sp. 12 AP-2014]